MIFTGIRRCSCLYHVLICLFFLALSPSMVIGQTCYDVQATSLIGIGGNLADSAPNSINTTLDIPTVPDFNTATPIAAQPGFAAIEAAAITFSTHEVIDESGEAHDLRIYYFKDPSGNIFIGVYALSEDVDVPFFTMGREGEPRIIPPDPISAPATKFFQITFDGSGLRNNTTPAPDFDYVIPSIVWTSGAPSQPLNINLNSVTALNQSTTVSNAGNHTNDGFPATPSAPVLTPGGDIIPVINDGSPILKNISGNVDGDSTILVGSIDPVPPVFSPQTGTTWEDIEAQAAYIHHVTVLDDKGFEHTVQIHFYRTAAAELQVGLYVSTLDTLPDGGASLGEVDFPREVGFINAMNFGADGLRTGGLLNGTYDVEVDIPWNTTASNSVIQFAFDPFSLLIGDQGICYTQINLCPSDPAKDTPGECGCGAVDTDTDGDGTADCNDLCPSDINKLVPGICGCGDSDVDTDGDGTADCFDQCNSATSTKIAPGACGCEVEDTDTDGDGIADCIDQCPADPDKQTPGVCSCGIAETDSDGDLVPDCVDLCPVDGDKTTPGVCGCNQSELNTDGDAVPDCQDSCPNDFGKTTPGICGCGIADVDLDANGLTDCIEFVDGHTPDEPLIQFGDGRRVTLTFEDFQAPVLYDIVLRKRKRRVDDSGNRVVRKKFRVFNNVLTTRLARGRWTLLYQIENGQKKSLKSRTTFKISRQTFASRVLRSTILRRR